MGESVSKDLGGSMDGTWTERTLSDMVSWWYQVGRSYHLTYPPMNLCSKHEVKP